ncbi:MAG: molybdopterin-dependent oxidoreductase, partial [Gammaproteobacteria bacterium]
LYQGCQGVHNLRKHVAAATGIDEARLRVVSPDVGGGFGLKMFLQCETVTALHASKQLGRAVKWLAERSESFLSDLHGRDQVTRAELAVDGDGRFLALRVRTDGNVGAYTSQAGAFIPWFGAFMLTGAYAIPVAWGEIRMVVTNTVPVDAYRGAGRPEAIYLIERLVDKAARELDIDPADIRRRNFIPPEAFPYETVTGQVYDSGDYATLLDAALERADWSGFGERRSSSEARGLLRGIGLSYYVEICSAMGGEDTHVRFEEDGTVTVLMGTQSTGQGHETSFGQMVAAGLGVPLDSVRVLQGDTKTIPTGQGTGGSRSMAIGGSALTRTVETVIESGRKIAGGLLEADAEDIEFEDGTYRIVGTDRTVTLREVAAASFHEGTRPEDVAPGLASSEHFTPEAGTFPNGCHICELEIDPETGTIEILRYTIEDDVGNVINPLILEGQIMGGVAQGLGQAMCEEAVYDRETGQLQTATFMDYTMPRAERMPGIDFHYTEVPSPRNPLGVKGAGEAGTIGAPPAFVNAVIDALEPYGVAHLDMPLTPMKVWEAIRRSRSAA